MRPLLSNTVAVKWLMAGTSMKSNFWLKRGLGSLICVVVPHGFNESPDFDSSRNVPVSNLKRRTEELLQYSGILRSRQY